MEAEPLELEDGEVVDDEPNDDFEGYTVLQRPHMVQPTEEQTKMGYSDESDNSVDSDSDSDSDASITKTKRPKLKIKRSKGLLNNRGTNNDNIKYGVHRCKKNL